MLTNPKSVETEPFHRPAFPLGTHRPLRLEEPADAVLELVEEHGVEGGAQIQAHQVLDVVADLQAHPLVVAHHQRKQPVQEAAQRRLGAHLAGAHRDHGALALAQGPHRGAVGAGGRGVALLEAHPTQGTQEAGHVDPLLEG